MFEILEINGKQYGAMEEISLLDTFLSEQLMKAPDSFYKFYSSSNGWKLADGDLQLTFRLKKNFGTRDSLSFDLLYSLEDIFLDYSSREGVSFPEGTIPFIDAQEGEIVISFRSDSFGKIYFCESNPTDEQMPENSFENAMRKFAPSRKQLPGIVVELADSFETFIGSLILEEWDQ
mgnify:CR=1 FL=1